MKTKTLKKDKVNIITLGCSKRLAAPVLGALVANRSERSLNLDLDANRILRVVDQLHGFQAAALFPVRYRDRS